MAMTVAQDSVETAIEYVEDNGVGILTLNRPQHLNTFRHVDYDMLLDLLAKLNDSITLRALVITAKGRAFSAGQDLRELDGVALPSVDRQITHLQKFQDITRRVIALKAPTITAFNGFAVGAGLEIAVACDFRIAVPDAYFLFSEARRGLFPTNGVLWLLPRLIGRANASEMLMLAQKFDAEYALRTGLISEIVEADRLLPRALELANCLAENAKDTVQGIKSLLRSTFSLSLEEMLEKEIEYNIKVMNGEDFEEGITAFLEKREPVFR